MIGRIADPTADREAPPPPGILRQLVLLWSPLLVAWLLGSAGFACTFVAGHLGGPEHWLAFWGMLAFLASGPIGWLGFGGAIAAVVMAQRIDPEGDAVGQRNLLWFNAPLLLVMSGLWSAVHAAVIGGTLLFVVVG